MPLPWLPHLQRYFRIEQWPAPAPTSNPFRPCTSPWIGEASSARAQCQRLLTSTWRNRLFACFFTCITNRFLEGWIACLRHAAQRGRCGLLSLVASVTVNLHIGLESGYLDKNGLAPWQPGPYLALCLLDSNKRTTLPPTISILQLFHNND